MAYENTSWGDVFASVAYLTEQDARGDGPDLRQLPSIFANAATDEIEPLIWQLNQERQP